MAAAKNCSRPGKRNRNGEDSAQQTAGKLDADQGEITRSIEEAAAPEIMPSVPPPAPIVNSGDDGAAKFVGYAKAGEARVVESKPTEEPVADAVETAPPAIASVPEMVLPEPAKPKEGNSWFSTSTSPWEAEAQKSYPNGIDVGCTCGEPG